MEQEPLLNGPELLHSFRQMMSKNFNGSSLQEMAKKLLNEAQEQFPQMLKLLTLALTVPVSSVEC